MPQGRWAIRAAAALACLTVGAVAQAQVNILSTYQVQGSLYHYEFRVLNLHTDTLAFVTLSGVPDLLDVQNLLAPTGFDAAYDPGLALVGLFEDSDPSTLPTFAPGTLQGVFAFDSALKIDSFAFEALDTVGTPINGSFIASAAPEPGSLTLSLCALGAVCAARRRLRRGNP